MRPLLRAYRHKTNLQQAPFPFRSRLRIGAHTDPVLGSTLIPPLATCSNAQGTGWSQLVSSLMDGWFIARDDVDHRSSEENVVNGTPRELLYEGSTDRAQYLTAKEIAAGALSSEIGLTPRSHRLTRGGGEAAAAVPENERAIWATAAYAGLRPRRAASTRARRRRPRRRPNPRAPLLGPARRSR
jgi:hypothetical protein